MVCEFNFVDPENDTPYFESVDDASSIISAFTSGKHVVFYLKNNTSGSHDYSPWSYMVPAPFYITLHRYYPQETNQYGETHGPAFGVHTGNYGMTTLPARLYVEYLTTISIAQNGKLHIEIYVD